MTIFPAELSSQFQFADRLTKPLIPFDYGQEDKLGVWSQAHPQQFCVIFIRDDGYKLLKGSGLPGDMVMVGLYSAPQRIYFPVIRNGLHNWRGEAATGTGKNCAGMKTYFYLSRWLTIIFLVTVVFLSDVLCEEPSLQDEKAPDSIDAIIESRDELAYDPTKHSIFPQFYHPLSRKLVEWEQKHGLEITVNYDVLVQGLTGVEEDTGGASGEIALTGRWLMFGEKFNKPAYLSFRLRNRHAYTDLPPSKIGSKAGLLWSTADGFTDAGFQVPDFYVDQELLKGDLILRYGQFSIDKFVDKHSLRNSKRYFLNQAFAKNPAVNFPNYGAGAVGTMKIGDRWGFVAGCSNIQGTDQLKGEVDLGITSSALFMTLQSSYSFNGFGGKSAQIQAMGWYDDNNREDDIRDGGGASVTFEHRGLREGENYVLRFASSDGKATRTKRILFLGYGREINDFDHFGIGLAAGQSSASSKWQGVMELYYQWQITKELLITPDFQLITGIGEEGNDLGFVMGLRAGVVF